MYFYVGFEGNEGNSWDCMLLTFWDQVSAGIDEPRPKSFTQFDDASEIREELVRLLATNRRRVYIVVDALDQLPQPERRRAIEGLSKLAKDVDSGDRTVRFVTVVSSRQCNELKDLAADAKACEIRVRPHHTKQDIGDFLKQKLDSELLTSEGLAVKEREKLQRKVSDTLEKQADGM